MCIFVKQVHISWTFLLYKAIKQVIRLNWEAHKPHTELNTIHDIWSGDTLHKDADLQTNRFLALGISTYCVTLFKSSKSTLWPVYFVIQNLPPEVHFKGENIILCGIWQGTCWYMEVDVDD